MLIPSFIAAVAVFANAVSAVGVVGAAEGFAKGTTGGGSATPVYPKTNAELVSYLGDSSARVIVLDRTFDFTGSEGTTTGTGCAPFGTAAACQLAIDKDSVSLPLLLRMTERRGLLGMLTDFAIVVYQLPAGRPQGQHQVRQSGLEPHPGQVQQVHHRRWLSRYHQGQGSLHPERCFEHHHPEHLDHQPEPAVRLGW